MSWDYYRIKLYVKHPKGDQLCELSYSYHAVTQFLFAIVNAFETC